MDEPTCSVIQDGERCSSPVLIKSRGWCSRHYQRWQKHGDPLGAPARPATCSLCDEPRHMRDLCKTHYRRERYAGDALAPDRRRVRRDPEERFWENVDKSGAIPAYRPELGPCWIWTGSSNIRTRYGRFYVDGRHVAVHRWSYEHFAGPIPDGLEIDHLCHPGDGSCPWETCLHRRCVNPAHLRPATRRENTLRGYTVAAINAAKTHCPKGHEYTPENTVLRPAGDGMGRWCRECARTEPFLGPRFNHNAAKTRCRNGHPYDEENTYYIKDGGGRRCKICMKATWTRRNAKVRAQKQAQRASGVEVLF